MSETTRNKTWSYLMIAGAVLMLVATFLPSMNVKIDALNVDEDGDWGDDLKDSDAENSRYYLWVGFLLAAIGAALGLVAALEAYGKFGGIGSIVGGVLGIIAWWNLNSSVSDANDEFGAAGEASMLIGGWVALVGAIVAIAGGGLSVKDEFM
jgi:ABC-type Fe3+ transport system permease subunit